MLRLLFKTGCISENVILVQLTYFSRLQPSHMLNTANSLLLYLHLEPI